MSTRDLTDVLPEEVKKYIKNEKKCIKASPKKRKKTCKI